MINKKIDDITEIDLQALIDNRVLEGKTKEYKRELPNNSDSSKKEFLADVTSFANTSGGDLIIGIDEDTTTREPTTLIGLEVTSIDSEKLRLDNIIRTGVEPRVHRIIIKPIPLSNMRNALLIRIPRSWAGPHRVILGGHAKFYARNSSGKYEMDIDELRSAFNLSETLIEKIRNFRADRITQIIADQTPVPLDSPNRIVLHLIHSNAFNQSMKYDVNSLYSRLHEKIPLLYMSVMNGRYNLDGLFSYSQLDNGKHSAYTQLFRNGIVEAVDSKLMLPAQVEEPAEPGLMRREFPNRIPSYLFEKKIMEATTKYLTLMSELTIEPPIVIFLSLLNVKNYKIVHKNLFSRGLIDRDVLLFPAEIIESYEVRAETILKPLFDLIWNACGEPESLNFYENGNWINSS